MTKPETPTTVARTESPGQASHSPTLSTDRAFVVHFYAAEAGADIEAGRAEHVRSGHRTHFRSWQELADFVRDVVGRSL